MFNHHFFGGDKSKALFESFLEIEKSDKIVLVVDPPFGGFCEVIGHTLKAIQAKYKAINKGKNLYI